MEAVRATARNPLSCCNSTPEIYRKPPTRTTSTYRFSQIEKQQCRGRPPCLPAFGRATTGDCPYDRLVVLLVKNRHVLRFFDVSDKLEQSFFMADVFPRRPAFRQFDFGDDESHSVLGQCVPCRGLERIQISDRHRLLNASALRHGSDVRHP